MAKMLIAAVLVAMVAGSAAQVPTSAPTKAPSVPTSAPSVPTPTPAAVPTPSPTPAVTTAPATPTPAVTTAPATPTKTTPTRAPLPAACSSVSQYRTFGKCAKCISSFNPSKQVLGGSACVNPTTLSSKSTKCSPYILPAFVRKPGTSKTTTGCIPQSSSTISILLPITSSKATFLDSASYRKPSLRLSNLRPRSVEGLVVYVIKGNRRLVQFNDKYRTIRKQRGKTIRLTGTLRPYVGAKVLRCFTAFVKVC